MQKACADKILFKNYSESPVAGDATTVQVAVPVHWLCYLYGVKCSLVMLFLCP